MEAFKNIVTVCGGVTTIGAILMVFAKLFLWMKNLREGLKCQLRSDMLHTYYNHKDEQKIRQYEIENFIYSYKAYKALKGNSFIDQIHEEVSEWEVVT